MSVQGEVCLKRINDCLFKAVQKNLYGPTGVEPCFRVLLAPALWCRRHQLCELLRYVTYLKLLALALLASLALGRLFGQKNGVDVRKNTAGGDGDTAEKFVQLFIVANGQLDVARDDASFLVVAGGIASKLENLGGQVLEHGTKVNRSSSANARGILALLEVTVHATNGELKTRLLGARNRLAALRLAASSRAFACLA
jgi:hypothetical protein